MSPADLKRHVPFEGAPNFRDLGGYETSDGRHVKSGLVFRSGDLSNLTDSDRGLFSEIGIKLVCDFRNTSDTQQEPDRLPSDGSVEYLHLPVTHGIFDTSVVTQMLKNGDTEFLNDQYMIDGYKRNIDAFAEVWGRVINCLVDPAHRPLVFHCAVGKDRAGTCAAIILLALNVPDALIISDYELSDHFLADWVISVHRRLNSSGIDPGKLAPFIFARRIYIQALLDYIRSRYDSVENYLTTKAGVKQGTINRLREELLS
ncbi:MAG: tyrosine-protein phosphatase [Deltaproteobacteria bacterium]|nr:tyrosine-protein phosphatase [Deltaproteobacteria bacterium]